MIYTIRKGQHYSDLTLDRLWLGYSVDLLVFGSKFIENPYYDLKNENNRDINKLYGISFGNHLKNSIRIGWNINYDNGNVNYYSYVHEDSKIYTKLLFDCPFDLYVRFGINTFFENFSITWSTYSKDSLPTHGQSLVVFKSINKPKWSYKLFPYFGGNEVAPYDIKINII